MNHINLDLAALRRSHRRLQLVVGGLILCLVGLSARTVHEDTPDVVRAHKFVVVGNDGRERAEFTHEANGAILRLGQGVRISGGDKHGDVLVGDAEDLGRSASLHAGRGHIDWNVGMTSPAYALTDEATGRHAGFWQTLMDNHLFSMERGFEVTTSKTASMLRLHSSNETYVMMKTNDSANPSIKTRDRDGKIGLIR